MKYRFILPVILGCLVFSGCQNNSEASSEKKTSESIAEDSRQETEEARESQEDTQQIARDEVSAPVTKEIFAMDTYMMVTAYGECAQSAVDKAAAEIERLDSVLSTGDEDSEIYALNQQGGGTVSEDTKYLLERSLEIWKDTGGTFDISIYPVMQAWGFTSGTYQVPSGQQLEELLSLVDSSKIVLDSGASTVAFETEGMQIDFGGIAKGYTSARIMDVFREEGVTSGLVSLGGNVQLLGSKPDGSRWRVGIQSPDSEEECLGILEAEDCAVITSGGYERYFEEDGVSYHHIIDPATGYPADGGLESVTIVSADGTLADGLSTALFIMGREDAIEFWRKHSDEFDAILLEEDGTLYVTEGISEHFTSDRNLKIVEEEG